MVDFMCETEIILLKPNFTSISISPYKNTSIFRQTASMNVFLPFRTRNLLNFDIILHKILNPKRNLYKSLDFFFLFSLFIRVAQLLECIITKAVNLTCQSDNTYIIQSLFYLFYLNSFEIWGRFWFISIHSSSPIFSISLLK